MGKLLFIDFGISEPQKIAEAVRDDVVVVLYDPATDTRGSIFEKIAEKGVSAFSDVGFVQHGTSSMSSYTFLKSIHDGQVYNVETQDAGLATWSELLSFYNELHTRYGVAAIDFISCCIYDDPSWVYILNELEKRTGVNFRASKNKTGSQVSGGDWIQESDGVDLRDIYFTEAITGYKHVLYPVFFRQYYDMLACAQKQTEPFGFGGTRITALDYTNPRNKCMVSASNPVVGMTTVPVPLFGSYITTAKLLVWGDATKGGNASSVSSKLSYIKSVIGSESAFAAIKVDGTAFAWGDSTSGGNYSSVENQLYNITHIASTQKAFAALRSDGKVITWGHASYGGNSSTVSAQLVNVVGIAATQSAFAALKNDGSVVVWGNSSEGGSASISLTGIQYISATSAAFAAIKTDGSVIAWGAASFGGSIPSIISSELTNILYISACADSFSAVKFKIIDNMFNSSEGSVVIWGNITTIQGASQDGIVGYGINSNICTLVAASKYGFCLVLDNNSTTTIGRNSYSDNYILKIESSNSYGDPIQGIYSFGKGFGIQYTNLKFDMFIGNETDYLYNIYGNNSIEGSISYPGFWGQPSPSSPIGFTTSNAFVIRPNSQQPRYLIALGNASTGGTLPTIPQVLTEINTGAANPNAFAIFYTSNDYTDSPTITSHTANQTIPVGGTLFLYANVSGSFPYTISWTKNGTQVSTSNPYIVQSAQITDAGSYIGNIGPSQTATISVVVYPAPTLISQSHSQTVYVPRGTSITLSATFSSTVTPTYQWAKASVAIAGQTSNSYVISSMSESNNGAYILTATTPAGSASTSTITLVVVDLPTITNLSSSAGQYVNVGTNTTLSFSAAGTTPYYYRWSKDGTPIAGATANTYLISSANRASAGFYTIDLSNNYGTTSSTISINIGDVPIIRSSPSTVRGDIGQSVSLVVDVSGDSPITYQWKKYNSSTSLYDNIQGATSTTYAISSLASSDAGIYRLYVSSIYGNTNTTDIQVLVGTLPTITQITDTITCISGDNISLYVVATSTTPMTYEWSKGSVVLGTTALYTKNNIAVSDAGLYKVKIQNEAGYIEQTVSVNVFTSISLSTLLSNTLTKNTEISAIINDISYKGYYADVSANRTFTFISSDSTKAGIIISSIPPTIATIACYTTSPSQDTTTGATTVDFGISLYNSSGIKISDVSNTPLSVSIIPGSAILASSINIYRIEGATRIFVGTATRNSSGTYTISIGHFSSYQAVQESVPCFVEGTRVLTARGFIAVEDLVRGDRIITADGRDVPFALARRTIERATRDSAPYLVPANAFGPGLPPAACRLSPTHAFQIRPGVWHFPEIAAARTPAIRQYGIGKSCTYYHIKLPDYFTDNIVLEGGTVAESFGDDLKDLGTIFYYSEKHGGFIRIDPRKKMSAATTKR